MATAASVEPLGLDEPANSLEFEERGHRIVEADLEARPEAKEPSPPPDDKSKRSTPMESS